LPEIQNPNFESRTPDSGGIRSLLSFIVLAVVLFFGLRYFRHGELTPAVPASQSQSHALQTEIAKASLPASQNQPIASHSEFGWLTFIAKPLYLVLRVLNDRGIHNWGWSIVALTVIFNLLIVWPRVMSMKSSLKDDAHSAEGRGA
jgi:membrane protein insertase Oxa1/YidC/SpoIIIJ